MKNPSPGRITQASGIKAGKVQAVTGHFVPKAQPPLSISGGGIKAKTYNSFTFMSFQRPSLSVNAQKSPSARA